MARSRQIGVVERLDPDKNPLILLEVARAEGEGWDRGPAPFSHGQAVIGDKGWIARWRFVLLGV